MSAAFHRENRDVCVIGGYGLVRLRLVLRWHLILRSLCGRLPRGLLSRPLATRAISVSGWQILANDRVSRHAACCLGVPEASKAVKNLLNLPCPALLEQPDS